MSKYSKEDILRMVDEEDVGFIRLQFTDVFGTVKNIAVTAGQLEQALNNECSFDGSGIDGFVRIEEDDMYLYPDLDSFEIFPWRPQTGKVARLICDIHKCDGTPFEGDSRYILKRVVREAAKMGIYPYISSDAAEMVKKWAGGIEITISPNICLISLLVIGSISAIVSVLALRKQTY